MTDKSVISGYTHRSKESQIANSGNKPIFVLPDDLPILFRKTNRKSKDRLHVESLAVISEKEQPFRDFLANVKERKWTIFSREDNKEFVVNGNIEFLVKWWKDARRKGSSVVGGQRGGAKKKAACDKRAEGMTKAEWENLDITNANLVEKYGCAIGTLRRIAGERGWQRDRKAASVLAEAAQKRREKRYDKR